MNNKKRFIALMMAVLMTFSCFMLAACSKAPEDTATGDEATTTAAANQQATGATAEENKLAVLKESYKPELAFDLTGKAVELTQVYGSSFKEHGGELCFKEDGTFTAFIGAYGNANTVTGTYKVLSMSEIELKYNNDTTKSAVITATDLEGNAVEIRLPENDFNVIFH